MIKKYFTFWRFSVILVILGYFQKKFYGAPNPPDKLLTSKYPNAKNIKWSSFTWGATADFDNKHYEAKFDKKHLWQETSTNITVSHHFMTDRKQKKKL